MPFPKTLDELRAAGYVFLERALCSGAQCTAKIDWWKTPNGRLIPVDYRTDGVVVAHFGTCPNSRDFQKKLDDAAPAQQSLWPEQK